MAGGVPLGMVFVLLEPQSADNVRYANLYFPRGMIP